MQFIFDISAEDDDPNGFIAAADRGSGPETEAREPTDKVPKMRVITLIYNKFYTSEPGKLWKTSDCAAEDLRRDLRGRQIGARELKQGPLGTMRKGVRSESYLTNIH